jgi:WD40 repeat protein/tetratricopeptide (TPR) repeat protein/tRNA A-37 threonylcarbamoyl transferase component Bud32
MSDSLSVSEWLRQEEICRRFEGAWQAAGADGPPPRVEDYLDDTGGPEARALLRELILLDLHYRRRRGERPGAEDYAACGPSLDTTWLAGECAAGSLPSTLEAGRTMPEGPAPSPAFPVIPGYQVLEELGRGGMGVVYRARQVAADRAVALKMIRSGALVLAEERDRFRTEARAVARLSHPHIVQVYEVGEHDSSPFFSMEYVPGGSLAGRLRASLPEPREAAKLVEALARAVEAVHQAGVIHRDLKPANVLLAPSDRPGAVRVGADAGEGGLFEPKVTDFGLAKRQGEDPGLTRTGQAMGTPSYMAPEQAEGRVGDIDRRTDVYGLGAILYECLTGRPPFRAATVAQTLQQVIEQDPVGPRQLNGQLPADLETICLKALAKSPGRRYATARALADDLRRWLAGEPVHARPVGRPEKLWRWCRRHPAPALAAAAVLATVVLAFGIVAHSRDEAVKLAQVNDELARRNLLMAEEQKELAAREAEHARQQEEHARQEAEHARQQEEHARQEREHARQERELRQAIQRGSANTFLTEGQHSYERGDVGRGILYLAHAIDTAHKAQADELERAGRTQLALWRTRWPAVKLMVPHADEVLAVAFSPDGKTLLTGGTDKKVRRWDAATGRPLGEPVEVAAGDGRPGPMGLPPWPGLGRPSDSLSLDPPPGRGPDGRPKFASEVVAVALSPDGRTLAVGTGDPFYRGRSQLVGPGDRLRLGAGLGPLGDRFGAFRGPDPFRRDLLHDPLGIGMDRMMAGAAAPLWDADTGKALHPRAFREPVWAVAFSPDGRTLVTGGGAYQKKDRLSSLMSPGYGFHDLPGYGGSDFLGGRGRRPEGGQAHLWDVAKGQHLRSLPHDNAVLAVAFSPDGRRVLTGSGDGTARLWAASTGRPLGQPLAHDGPVVAVAFSPDGQIILTCCQTSATRGEARLWDADTGQPLGQPLAHSRPLLAAAFSPDGRNVLTGSGDPASGKGEAHLWAVATGKPLGQPLPHPGPVHAVAWSPDGRWVVTGCADGVARVWQAVRTPAVIPLAHHENTLAYSPDGGRALLGTPSADGQHCEQIALATTAPGHPPIRLSQESRKPELVAFSPDGRTVLIQFGDDKDGGLRLVDAVGGRLIGKPLRPDGSFEAAAVGPDGHTVLVGTSQPYQKKGEATLWDARTAQRLQTFSFTVPVLAVAFSPDGRTAATGSGMPGTAEGEARLWDVETGRLLRALPHPAPVRVVLFSPDSRTLATADDGRAARLWDVASGETRGAPLAHAARVRALAFSADGGRLLTGSDDQTAQLWDAATGRPVGAALVHRGPVRAVAVSGDGRLLATGGDDRTARLWEAATGQPLDEPLTHSSPVVSVAFGAGGRTLLTRSTPTNTVIRRRVGDAWETSVGVGWRSTGWVWSLPEPVGDGPADVLLWAQVFTGLEMDAEGRMHPLDAAAWRERRGRLGERGDPSPAEGALHEWHRREARAAEAAGEWFAAAWHLGRLGEGEPASEDLPARRGRAYYLSNRWDEAVAELTKALKSGGARGELWHYRGLAYAALNRDDEAVADFSQAISLEGVAGLRGGRSAADGWVLWFHRAQAYFRLGRMDKVVEDLSQVLKMKPDHGPSWHGRGLARAELGETERAVADFAAALRRPDAPARTWFDLALARLERGDADGYRESCARALTHFAQAEDPALAALLAWTCSLGPGATADPEAVLRLAQQATRQGAETYVSARALGAALYRAGKYQEAVDCLTRATQLRKQPVPAAWLLLAMAHQRLKHAEDAKKWLDKAGAWVEQAKRRKPGEGGDEKELSWHKLPWNERLALTLLQREAEGLLKESGKDKGDAP